MRASFSIAAGTEALRSVSATASGTVAAGTLYEVSYRSRAVLAGLCACAERKCAPGQSLFELYPHVIVSSDFIKSDRHHGDFLRVCPDLIIVDEAHSFAFDSNGASGKHLRHKLLQGLSKNQERHLILTTATPHSGNEGTFRSLLGLLKEEFCISRQTICRVRRVMPIAVSSRSTLSSVDAQTFGNT